MQTLIKHIKSGVFKNLYLLYGEEEYLIQYYKNKLIEGILKESPKGNINYHLYEGSAATVDVIAEQSKALPFFADSLLIEINNSGLFKRANELAKMLETIPESTYIIFVEHDVDKRNGLYKFIKQSGTVAEIMYKKDSELVGWIAGYLKRYDCLITSRGAKLLLSKVGVDMNSLINELDKLIAYADATKQIDINEVEAVCTTTLSSRIFAMMDNVVSGKTKEALELYKDLIALKESPLAIMALLTRHYNILLQIKEMAGETEAVIASKLSIPSFSVKKYKAQAGVYNKQQLKSIVVECINTEQDIKSGKLGPQVGIEVLIVKFSKNVAR